MSGVGFYRPLDDASQKPLAPMPAQDVRARWGLWRVERDRVHLSACRDSAGREDGFPGLRAAGELLRPCVGPIAISGFRAHFCAGSPDERQVAGRSGPVCPA